MSLSAVRTLVDRNLRSIAIVAAALAGMAVAALAEQDKYAVKVPNGLAFSEQDGEDPLGSEKERGGSRSDDGAGRLA